jgi:NAD(P)-dependent dehydrogenase (short-subunit alcohol dehydrogenase family)
MTERRVALVTGSGKRRVGWHVADALAKRGYALALHYRSSAAEAAEAVAVAARELNRLREGWLNPPGADAALLRQRTLTTLYNQRPTWLDQAHERLDRAVHAAYGWTYPLGDEEILERLVALNLRRSEGQVSASAGGL